MSIQHPYAVGSGRSPVSGDDIEDVGMLQCDHEGANLAARVLASEGSVVYEHRIVEPLEGSVLNHSPAHRERPADSTSDCLPLLLSNCTMVETRADTGRKVRT